MSPDDSLVLGLDVGTSGVRCVALDAREALVAQARVPLPPPEVDGARITQDPRLWWDAVDTVIVQVAAQVDPTRIAAIAVDGTSGTLLVTDAQGAPASTGWLYQDASCVAEAARIARVAPADSPARGSSSPLARLLHLQTTVPQAAHVQHQADWIAGRLCGRTGVADANNVLKLGHDAAAGRWPGWFAALGVREDWLPEVVAPGTAIGTLRADLAAHWRLPHETVIAAGTTDGVAAFLATGASQPGDAVTSLGSTLVVKLLATQPVADAASGVYSHRLVDLWLPGGASNAGGAALARWFDVPALEALSARIDAEHDSGLDYYPLPATGERFPIADPALAPRVTPRPDDDVHFLHGLLDGLVAIERLAYERLAALGAGQPQRLFAVGSGARNPAWRRLRERRLGVPLLAPRHEEAACGTARLARQALRSV